MFNEHAVTALLEGSAGRGDLITNSGASRYKGRCDCIESMGDNIAVLKQQSFRVIDTDFLPFSTSKVYSHILINPPYNTKSAFEHYDDNLEHSIWLSTIYPRFELLRELLSEDGRMLIIEYKGAHLADGSNTAAKQAVGELWADSSSGARLFLMAFNNNADLSTREQIINIVQT